MFRWSDNTISVDIAKMSGYVKTFKDKVKIRIRIINWCLCALMMIRY